jgi:DNA-binding CsgD family transcriptional regulator
MEYEINSISSQRKFKLIAILSRDNRFKELAKSSLISGERKFKQLDSLGDLLNFSLSRKNGTDLIIDLVYAPEIDSITIKKLRNYGWVNIVFVAPKANSHQINRICQDRTEAIVLMPENSNSSPLAEKMTQREIAIMQLLADGFNINAIAQKLHFSPNTIKRNLESMLRRLGYTRRVRLLADLFRQGVLK